MNTKTISYILLALCNLFWAGNYVIGKIISGMIEPLWIVYIRWLFAAVILLIVSTILEKPSVESIKRNLVPLMLMGLFGMVGYNTILYTALKFTSSLNASLINSLNPGLLLILSSVVLKEKLTPASIIGIVISLLGALVVITGGQLGLLVDMTFNTGDLMMLLAITVWSLYSLVLRRLRAIGPVTAVAYAALFSVLMMTPFIWRMGGYPIEWPTELILSMIYIIVFPSVGSFLSWNYAIKHVEVGKAGMSINLNPVFIALITWAIGMSITAAQLMGGALVIMGMLVAAEFWRPRQLTR